MSIVPYVAARSLATLAARPYATLGAYTAWKDRRYAYKAAGKIMRYGFKRTRRMIKRRRGVKRARKTYRVGERPGSGTIKNAIIHDSDTAVTLKNTRTFYWYNCVQIEKTSSNSIHQREREMCNFRGFKVCAEVRNLRTTEDMYCNMAIISPKGAEVVFGSVGSGSATAVSDFFRNAGGNQRGLDFGTANTGIENHCSPINADLWNVMGHTRFVLGASNSAVRRKFRIIQKYIKVNRQIRYETGNDHSQSPIYLCYWFDEVGEAGGTAVTTAAIGFQQKIVAYFREPK